MTSVGVSREAVSDQRCSLKKGVHKDFSNFTGTQLSDFFERPQACNFIKKETLDRCFPVKFAKPLRKTFCRTTPDD